MACDVVTFSNAFYRRVARCAREGRLAVEVAVCAHVLRETPRWRVLRRWRLERQLELLELAALAASVPARTLSERRDDGDAST